MAVNEIVYAIKLIGDASGGINAVQMLENALQGLGPSASGALRGLHDFSGLTAPLTAAQQKMLDLANTFQHLREISSEGDVGRNLKAVFSAMGDKSGQRLIDLTDERMSKREAGLTDSDKHIDDSEALLAVYQQRHRDLLARGAQSATNKKGYNQKELQDSTDAVLRAERMLFNAKTTFSRKLYEYRLAMMRKEIDEEGKLEKTREKVNTGYNLAEEKAKQAGLTPGSSEGSSQATKVLDLVNKMGAAVLGAGAKIRENLPKEWAGALNEIGKMEKQAMQNRLQLAIDEANQRKTIAETAAIEVATAEANATANPADKDLQAEYEAKALYAKKASAEQIQAELHAKQVADHVAKQSADALNKAAEEQKASLAKVAQAWADLKAKAGATFNYLKRNFNEMTNSVNKLVNSYRLMTQGLQELFTILSFSVAAPLVLVFKQAIQGAIDLEYQMAKVKKAVEMPEGAKGYAELERRLRNLSKITPTSVEQLSTFAEQAGQLGVRGMAGVYRFTNLINKVTIGTDVNAQSIAEDMGRIAAAFGMDLNTEKGMDSLERMSSVMDYVAKKTATDMNGIVSAVKDAAVAGQLLGIHVKDVVTMTGMLISAGVDASAAGTNLSRFFTGALHNADKYSDAMKDFVRTEDKFGTALKESVQPYKDAAAVTKEINDDPVQVLTDTLEALNTATDDKKAQSLKNFMDAVGFVGARIGAMAGNWKDLKEMLRKSGDEWDNMTTLQQDYTAMLMTTDAQVKIFKNNLDDLGVTVGSSVMPAINKAISYAIPLVQMLAEKFTLLSQPMQMMIVLGPLLIAALIPILTLVFSLMHALGMIAMAGITAVIGIGQAVFAFVGLLGRMVSGVITLVKWLGAAEGGLFKLGQAFTWIGGSTLGVVLSVITGVVAVFKILTMMGLNISKYFTELATQAKTWGENIMKTFGGGLIAGAAQFVAKAIQAIASLIASFFEAHSPPKTGPLSTIDQWGQGLMNTYLRGFFTADFSILDEIAGIVRSGLEAIGGLNDLDMTTILGQFKGAREALANLMATFNKTGEIAGNLLNKITSGLGSLGPDVSKLITLWMKYKKIQEDIKKIEDRRKKSNKAYEKEADAISRMNISAEEKAYLLRQASMKHSDELGNLDEEEKALKEQSEEAKDKLDWQKAYVEAQIQSLELLKQIKEEEEKAADGGFGTMTFDSSAFDEALGAVEDLGEEWNVISENIERAKAAGEQFWNGLNGKKFGEGMTGEDMQNWAKRDGAGMSEALQMYDAGKKASGIWTELQGTFEGLRTTLQDIQNMLSQTDWGKKMGIKPTEDYQKQLDAQKKAQEEANKLKQIQPPPIWVEFTSALQPFFDIIASNSTLISDLDMMFVSLQTAVDSVNSALQGLLDAMGIAETPAQSFTGILKVLGGALGVGIVLIGAIVQGIVGGLVTAFTWVVSIIGQVIAGFLNLYIGFLTFGQGIGLVIKSLFTNNVDDLNAGLQRIGEGIAQFLLGLGQALLGFFGGLTLGILDTVASLLESLVVALVQIIGGPEAAKNAKALIDWWRSGLQDGWKSVGLWFAEAQKNVAKFFNDQIKRVKELNNTLAKVMPNVFHEVSMEDAGETTVGTFAQGIDNNKGAVVQPAKDTAGLIADFLGKKPTQGPLTGVQGWGTSMVGSYGAGVTVGLPGLGTDVSGVGSLLSNYLGPNPTQGPLTNAGGWGSSFVGNFGAGMANGVPGLGNQTEPVFGYLQTVFGPTPTAGPLMNAPAWGQGFMGNWLTGMQGSDVVGVTEGVTGQITTTLGAGMYGKSDSVRSTLDTGMGYVTDFSKSMPGTLGQGLDETLAVAVPKLNNLEQQLSLWGEKAKQVFTQLGVAIPQALTFAFEQGALSTQLGLYTIEKQIVEWTGRIRKAFEAMHFTVSFTGVFKMPEMPVIPQSAAGGITTGPTLSWVGEGTENEAIIPLSKLPGMMASMYSQSIARQGGGANGDGEAMVIQINHPVIREEDDIKKLAKAVKKEIELTLESKRRMRGN